MVQKTNLVWSVYQFFLKPLFIIQNGIIYSLTDKAILLSDKEFHINNCVRSMILKNGYSLEPLNKKIFERYKKLIANLHKTNQVGM